MFLFSPSALSLLLLARPFPDAVCFFISVYLLNLPLFLSVIFRKEWGIPLHLLSFCPYIFRVCEDRTSFLHFLGTWSLFSSSERIDRTSYTFPNPLHQVVPVAFWGPFQTARLRCLFPFPISFGCQAFFVNALGVTTCPNYSMSRLTSCYAPTGATFY